MNVAEELIHWLHEDQLQVDEAWSVKTERGFTWWADKNAQRVEIVGSERDPELGESFLIQISTDFLRGLALTEKSLPALGIMTMAAASMGGPVYDEQSRTLRLSTALRVHSGNVAPSRALLSLASVMQIGEARILGHGLAKALHAEAAESGHPRNGVRPEPDEMAEVVATAIAPRGAAPPRWDAREFSATAKELSRQYPEFRCKVNGSQLAVTLAGEDHFGRSEFYGNQRHPRYGNGLFCLHTFPIRSESEEAGIRLALALNALELTKRTSGYGLGSYCYQNDLLHFVGFIPNLGYQDGLLMNLCLASHSRAVELRQPSARL